MQTKNLSLASLLERMRMKPIADPAAILQTINKTLLAAGLDPHAGPMKGVTETISRAFASAGLGAAPNAQGPVIDVVAREIDGASPASREARPSRGKFASHSHTNHAGTRAYKLYVPAERGNGPLPMIVMLHGCSQSPDDFAAGTRMNELAEQHGFIVVYPAQTANANGSKCWNWFRARDQQRDSGEPAIIAGIVREVAAEHRADERRIFVAGLSAGAAMAVILGHAYPELFAAVGAHSGLPAGAAHDTASAFAAMHGSARSAPRREAAAPAVPTIVFHGDRDATVNPGNGEAIVARAAAASAGLRTRVERRASPGGRRYTRTVHVDAADRPIVEQWELHGAGHAWSGGSASGSFTDATGPDASAEMVRFFLSQARSGTA